VHINTNALSVAFAAGSRVIQLSPGIKTAWTAGLGGTPAFPHRPGTAKVRPERSFTTAVVRLQARKREILSPDRCGHSPARAKYGVTICVAYESRAAARRARFEMKSIPTSSGAFAVHESVGHERGPAAVLIHGNSSSSDAFSRQHEGRLGERFKLIAVDLTGHGAFHDAEDPGQEEPIDASYRRRAGRRRPEARRRSPVRAVAHIDPRRAASLGWRRSGFRPCRIEILPPI